MKKVIAQIIAQRFGPKPVPAPGWIGSVLKKLNNSPQPARKKSRPKNGK